MKNIKSFISYAGIIVMKMIHIYKTYHLSLILNIFYEKKYEMLENINEKIQYLFYENESQQNFKAKYHLKS